MAKINTLNYQTVAAWNGSQDLFVVEQPDGTKVATPAMVKQFIEAGDFVATGEIEDGYGNKLSGVVDEIGDLSQTGITGATIAAQLLQLNNNIKFKTSGEWKWIELPNKLVFMWCNHNFGAVGDLTQEGPFYRKVLPKLDYPLTFASLPGVWVQKQEAGQGLVIGTSTSGSTTQTPDFTLARFTSGPTIFGCLLSYFVVGIKA